MKVETFYTTIPLTKHEVENGLDRHQDFNFCVNQQDSLEEYDPYDEDPNGATVIYEVTFKPIKMKSNKFVDVSL